MHDGTATMKQKRGRGGGAEEVKCHRGCCDSISNKGRGGGGGGGGGRAAAAVVSLLSLADVTEILTQARFFFSEFEESFQ